MRRDPFQAIADPTRRAIIAVLVKKPLTLNRLAENFTISRPAVSKQIKILNQCGLVKITPKGRERHCEVDLVNLNMVVNWLEEYRSFWDNGEVKTTAKAEPSSVTEEVDLPKKIVEEAREEEKKQNKKNNPSPYQYSLF